jgi:hypothetical protein
VFHQTYAAKPKCIPGKGKLKDLPKALEKERLTVLEMGCQKDCQKD